MAGVPVNGLKGKIVLITGASRGIGEAIAFEFARHEPSELLLVSRSEKELVRVAEQCKAQGARKVRIYPCDLCKSSSVASLLSQVYRDTANYGVDVLVNNAGMGDSATALRGAVSDDMIYINLLAPIVLTKSLAPRMVARSSGSIINISSVAGVEPSFNGVYSATKFGLRGWTQHCYQVLSSSNIKVLGIYPGFVATEMVSDPRFLKMLALSLDRMMAPKDVAKAALLPFVTSTNCTPSEIVLKAPNAVFASKL